MEYKSSPKRPYLLRAYYDWLVDNSFTPYLVVDATYLGVNVPVEYVKDGQIVLNCLPVLRAIYNLQMISSSLMRVLKVFLVNCIFQWVQPLRFMLVRMAMA